MKKVKSKISLFVIAGITLTAIGIQSCSKSSSPNPGPPPPTPIGGYVSSDSVAPDALIAYFPFDANANDVKGNLTATAVGSGVTFSSAGIRGNAYQGAQGAYFTLPVPSGGGAYTNIGSYSESVWFKLAATDTLTQGMFFLSGATTQDELVTEIEPYKAVALDSIKIHTGFNDLNSPAYQLFVPETFDTLAIAKWVHMVITYNAGTGAYIVYQDANATGTNTAFSPPPPAGAPYPSPTAYVTPNILYTDGTKATLLGPIGFTKDPPQTMIVGSWPDGLFGQVAAKTCFINQMDELRIYNRALTQTEVTGLFLNGQAGR
jgi:Concanavalin A-like lectin/glucanases superfamily